MTTITLPFELGVTVWHPSNGHNETWVTCPECMGSKVVTLTLGNGEQYQLGCAACGPGYEQPRGVVKETKYCCVPESFTPRRFSIEGSEIHYSESSPESNSWSHVPSTELFHDKAECQRRCDELNAQRDAHAAKYQYDCFLMKRKEYAFSVHYWRGQRKDYQRKLELVEMRLKEIKEKVSA